MRRAVSRDKRAMIASTIQTVLRGALDFALPPRCAGCGTIVSDTHSFCADCWTRLDFLGSGGCDTCGLPLQATESQLCAACLAKPPRLARMRAAVAYDELSGSLAMQLKYGRKVAVAKTMARYMEPLVGEVSPDAFSSPCRFIGLDYGAEASINRRWLRTSFRDDCEFRRILWF